MTDSPPASPLQADLRAATQGMDAQVWNAMRGRSIFITGGTGFVGGWLVEALMEANRRLDLGLAVTVLSRNPGAFAASCPHLAADAALRLQAGDVTSFDFPAGHFDMAVHAALPVASPSSGALQDTARAGALRVAAFARERGVQRLLHVSSGAVYGPQAAGLALLAEDTSWDLEAPANDYTCAKRAEEQLLAEAGLPALVTARCFAMIGPRQPAASGTAAAQFVAQAARGEAISVQGDGLAVRSYLYAADMAAWLLTLLALGRPQAAYNIGSEDAVSIAELAREVSAAAGLRQPVRIAGAAAAGRAGARYVPDTALARRELGLQSRIGLAEAIARSLQWARVHPTTIAP